MALNPNVELEKEFILRELDQERIIWLGSRGIEECEAKAECSYARIDYLLGELSDVTKVILHEAGTD